MAQANNQIIQAAIEGLEGRKKHIDEMIANLRQKMTGGTSAPTSALSQTGRTMSAAARKRIADAQRRRWAAVKKGITPQEKVAQVKKTKRRLSPEGRRRIIEATKKRWAAQKKAAK